MWPFRRRENWIDVRDLKALEETRLPVKYVNLLLLDLSDNLEREFVLRSSQPLPITVCDQLDEMPTFAEVVNRLKVMSDLDPVRYPQVKEGQIKMWIGRVGYVVVHTRFDDTAADPALHLRMEHDTSRR